MHAIGVQDVIEPTAAISRTIGRRVRASRTELGWTLDRLAARSGVSRRMLISVARVPTAVGDSAAEAVSR
jgi:ribosome-binding protein aMBF1 (putative translation factor)